MVCAAKPQTSHAGTGRATSGPRSPGHMAAPGYPANQVLAQCRHCKIRRRRCRARSQFDRAPAARSAIGLSGLGMVAIFRGPGRKRAATETGQGMVQSLPRRGFCCGPACSHPVPMGRCRIELLPTASLATFRSLPVLPIKPLEFGHAPARAAPHGLCRMLAPA